MTDRLTDWLMSDINPSVCNYYISVEYIDICGPSLISATEPGQHSGLRQAQRRIINRIFGHDQAATIRLLPGDDPKSCVVLLS